MLSGVTFTLPHTDLFLPSPFPLDVTRSYRSSARHRDVGLGFGWHSSLLWTLEIRRSEIAVIRGDGTELSFPRLRPNESTSRGAASLHSFDHGFVLETGDRVFRVFVPGPRDGFHVLASARDTSGNRIGIDRRSARETQVIDAVGREIRLSHDDSGRIKNIAVIHPESGQTFVFGAYQYDLYGNLVSFVDADGNETTYEYASPEEHLLTAHRAPTGLTFHFVYDRACRCVETWGDYPGADDEALGEDVPKVLADGETQAKGVLHVRLHYARDWTELSDSRRTQRFFPGPGGAIAKGVDGGQVTTRSFDVNGNVTAITDALGHEYTFEYDARGRLLGRTDPLGRAEHYRRDPLGNLIAATDPLGHSWERAIDAPTRSIRVVDPLQATTSYTFDARGMLSLVLGPTGTTERCRYDLHGNLIEHTDASGQTWRFRYDYFGRRIARIDPSGGITSVQYSLGGYPLSRTDPTGATEHFVFDGAGRVIAHTDADGRTRRFGWGGYNWLSRVVHPNGDQLAIKYDREGGIIEQRNERGEVHRRTVDSRGLCRAEATFDGRRLEYRYDALGREIARVTALGARTTSEYDGAGQLVAQTFHDGVTDRYEYDARGDLVSVTSDDFDLVRTYDPARRRMSERYVVRGPAGTWETEIEYGHDSAGREVRRRIGSHHVFTTERDASGRTVRSVINGRDVLTRRYDARGVEVERHLPGGATIQTASDATRRPIRLELRPPIGGNGAARSEGAAGDSTTLVAYEYTRASDILARYDHARGFTRYRYDVRRRLVAVDYDPPGDSPERFTYDATNNVSEVDASGRLARQYERGNRLVRRGDVDYTWDDDGRIVERNVTSPHGAREAWRYAWSARGDLIEVRRPDDTVVRNVYDHEHRRLAKYVYAPTGPASVVLHRWTYFTWVDDALIQEEHWVSGESGARLSKRVTHCVDPGEMVPWGRKEDDARGSRILYLVTDLTGAPAHAVDERGQLVTSFARRAYGRVTQGADVSDTRFTGQQYDADIDLTYNHHRYYDQDAGRYISADPIGLWGDLNAYVYGINPVNYIDPLGLAHCASARIYNPDGSECDPIPPTWNTSGAPGGHSEDEIIKKLRNRTDLEGKTVAITAEDVPSAADPGDRGRRGVGPGEEPTHGNHACPSCAPKLDQLAQQKKMQVTYQRSQDNGRGLRLDADYRDPANPRSNLNDYLAQTQAARDAARRGLR